MRTQTARLDRRIIVERPVTVTEQRYGTDATEWEEHATLFAQVQDVLPSRAESVADGISVARRPCRIRTRFRTDITGDMRIVFGTRIMRIVSGPAELGRREGLELLCEEYSTEGAGI
jgi:SPP1 family predicted phage head-tail adaptor